MRDIWQVNGEYFVQDTGEPATEEEIIKFKKKHLKLKNK